MTKDEKDNIKYEKFQKLIQEIFKLLNYNNKLDIDLLNKDGKNALQIALENQNIPFLHELIKMKPKLFFQDTQGKTIFHIINNYVFGEEKERKVFMIIINTIKDNIKDED